MILRETLKRSLLMQWKSHAGYIHMEGHLYKINPQRQQLSYNNPKVYRKTKELFPVPLGKKGRVNIERGKFREYKERMLDPTPDREVEPDTETLWYGRDEPQPQHYFAQLPAKAYFKLSSLPQSRGEQFVHDLFQPNPNLTNSIDFANLQQYDQKRLVQIALKVRLDKNYDLKIWHAIDLLLEKKLEDLQTVDVARLKWAFSGVPKRGRPITHQILRDLLLGDLRQMDVNELIATYSAFKHDNVCHQVTIANRIIGDAGLMNEINNSAKLMVDFIRAYAGCRSVISRKRYFERPLNEQDNYHSEVVSKLNVVPLVSQMPLNDVVHIFNSLFTSRIEGIQHILLAIHSRFLAEYQKLTPKQAFEVLFVSLKIESGEYVNISLFQALKPTFLANWEQYTDLEKLKIVYCYWDVHDWEEFKPLYDSIPIVSDAAMLYYFCQIEMIDPSERQPDVARALFKLEYVPLPYHYRLRQYHHHLQGKYSKWNFQPLEQKFFQTEKYFTPLHIFKNTFRQPEFVELGKFLSTVACKFTPLMVSENTELVQFGLEDIFVAVEALSERYFLPDGKMKKSAMLKPKCLEAMGWSYVGLRWKSFRETPRNKQLEWLKEAMKNASYIQVASIKSMEKDNRQSIEDIIEVREQVDMHPDAIEEMVNENWADVVEQEDEVIDEEQEMREIEAKRIRRIKAIKETAREMAEEERKEAEMQ